MNVELEAMYARMADRAKPKPEILPPVKDFTLERLAVMNGWMHTDQLALLWGIRRSGAYVYLYKLHETGHVQRRQVKRAYKQRFVEWKRKEEKPQ